MNLKALVGGLAVTLLSGCNQEVQPPPLTQQETPLDVQAARLIGGNLRMADVANFMLQSGGRNHFVKGDIETLEVMAEQLTLDAELNRLYGSLTTVGYDKEIVPDESGYIIRGRWRLETQPGSPFDTIFPTGAHLAIHGESIGFPLCGDGEQPLIIQAELFPINGEKAGVQVTEETENWRLFIEGAEPYQHRIMVDVGCIPAGQGKGGSHSDTE